MPADDRQVTDVLDELRARVRAGYAAAGAAVAPGAADQTGRELQSAIQDANINATVNGHLPLLWEDPVLGRAKTLVQRVLRRLLEWYINPIVEQQNRFNAAAARALTLLAAENARLQQELRELQAVQRPDEANDAPR